MAEEDPQSPFHDGAFPAGDNAGPSAEAHPEVNANITTDPVTRSESTRSRDLREPVFSPPRRSATASLAAQSHIRTESPTQRNRGRSLLTGANRPSIDTNVDRSPMPRSPLARGNSRDTEHMADIMEEGVSPRRARRSMASERDQSIAAVLRQASVLRNRAGTINRRPRGNTMASLRPTTTGISSAHSIGRTNGSIQGGEDAFTLAGPSVAAALPANVPFVQPGYAELNPAYEQQAEVVNNRPVWGLAKPLPRVIRPGMVPTVSEIRETLGQPSKADEKQSSDVDLEKGRADKLPIRKVDSRIQVARERRESRLLERLTSIDQQQAHGTAHDGVLTPPNEAAELPEYFGEEDIGLARPATGQVSAHGRHSTTVTEPFVAYNEDDSASTIHEDKDPDMTDDEWLDTQLHKLDPHDVVDEIHNHHTQWSVIRTRFREPFAEVLAVTVQLTLGFCADLVVTTSNQQSGNEETTDWAWGLASMIGIYIAGGISGAHLNPAISIMLYIYRGFPLRKVPVYIFAQLLGAFIAGLLAYGLYRQNIHEYGGDILATGGTMNSFITSVRYPYINAATAFFNEFVGSAFLAIAVLALGDDSNAPPGAGMNAFILGLVITCLSMAFGYNTGAALNGTRDLGPRLALLCVGYGGEIFRNWWWVCGPWLATISGVIVGAGVYDVLIFVGGESPVNYPKRRIKRAAHKWKKRTGQRIGRAKRRLRGGEKDDDVRV